MEEDDWKQKLRDKKLRIWKDSVRPTVAVEKHLVQISISFFQQDDFDLVVDALQEQLAIVADNLLPLGSFQGAHQRLEDIGTAVVVKQHAERHRGLTARI